MTQWIFGGQWQGNEKSDYCRTFASQCKGWLWRKNSESRCHFGFSRTCVATKLIRGLTPLLFKGKTRRDLQSCGFLANKIIKNTLSLWDMLPGRVPDGTSIGYQKKIWTIKIHTVLHTKIIQFRHTRNLPNTPWKTIMDLKMHPWKRRFLLETIISGSMLVFGGYQQKHPRFLENAPHNLGNHWLHLISGTPCHCTRLHASGELGPRRLATVTSSMTFGPFF